MQRKKAISLIVLVITIIVMIILASAIILSLSNTGVIDRAEEAVEKTNEAQVNQLVQLAWAEAYADGIRDVDEFKTAVEEALVANGITGAEREKYNVVVTEKGAGAVKPVTSEVNEVPIPKGFVASQATGENTVEGGLVIYEGTTPVTDANVEVAKRTRNQYVWVPVPKATFKTEFIRRNLDNDMRFTLENDPAYDVAGETILYEIELDENNIPLEEQDENYISKETAQEAKLMYESVAKYSGFYIGRYEVGLEDVNEVASLKVCRDTGTTITGSAIHTKMNKIPYNNIPLECDNGEGAIKAARSVYTLENTSYGVVSTITYSVQWDTILKWWLDTSAVASVTDATSYGNYKAHEIKAGQLATGSKYSTDSGTTYTDTTSELTKDTSTTWHLTTGALNEAKVKNIYDMAGNIDEFSMENWKFIAMEGYYNGFIGTVIRDDGTTVSGRYQNRGGGVNIGFRLALYVK